MRDDVELTPAWFGHRCDFHEDKIVLSFSVFVNGDEGGMARKVTYELGEPQAFLFMEEIASALRRSRYREEELAFLKQRGD